MVFVIKTNAHVLKDFQARDVNYVKNLTLKFFYFKYKILLNLDTKDCLPKTWSYRGKNSQNCLAIVDNKLYCPKLLADFSLSPPRDPIIWLPCQSKALKLKFDIQ